MNKFNHIIEHGFTFTKEELAALLKTLRHMRFTHVMTEEDLKSFAKIYPPPLFKKLKAPAVCVLEEETAPNKWDNLDKTLFTLAVKSLTDTGEVIEVVNRHRVILITPYILDTGSPLTEGQSKPEVNITEDDEYRVTVTTTNTFDPKNGGNTVPIWGLPNWDDVFMNALVRMSFRMSAKKDASAILPKNAVLEFTFQVINTKYGFYTWEEKIKCGTDPDSERTAIRSTVKILTDYDVSVAVENNRPAVSVIAYNILGDVPGFKTSGYSVVAKPEEIHEALGISKTDELAMWDYIESGKVIPILGFGHGDMNKCVEASFGIMAHMVCENETNPKFTKTKLVLS